ncbi:divergent polysaccharide deacetylase family protein [Pseudomonas sp. B392_1p]|uniref:divergent polysaccharide deacetylase family protein n=1 Tax=Pseudomonas sp. B392_1p TaxID=3457507 RepID=UPI003FD2A146
MTCAARALIGAFGLLLSLGSLAADGSQTHRPRLSLIIDDIGNNPERDRRVLELSGPVALAVLPDSLHADEVARAASRAGKTVLLHMPMAPADGPYAWRPGQPHEEWQTRLNAALARVPHARGLNNHMGSQMTADPQAMAWLMPELQQRHLFFVDSRTNAATVAAAEAQRIGLASLSRDVFLDHDQGLQAVAREFARAVELARRQGSVVMIGHPHLNTLAVLERELPNLAEQGIDWIDVPAMIALRGNRAMAAHGKNGVYRTPPQTQPVAHTLR